MREKKQTSVIGRIIVFCLMISFGFLSGCTSNTNPDSSTDIVSYPVLSQVDYTILNQAYTDYDLLRDRLSPMEARQQLLEKLQNQTGVKSAELGLDGYTIFVTYIDGGFTGINTFELDEEAVQYVGFSNRRSTPSHLKNQYLSEHTLRFNDLPEYPTLPTPKKYPGQTEYNILIVGPEGKTTCESKKVLILGPCYWEFPKEPTDNCITSFQQHGWTDEDLSIKLVSINPTFDNTDCLSLTPNDYFDLQDYGIILFVGHGLAKVYDDYNETGMYLEFCYLNNASFVNNPIFQTWLDNKQIYVAETFTIGQGDSAQYIYRTAIRGDLLRSQMKGSLPSSYVYLATCYGGFFNTIFLDKGAKIVLGWDNLVKAVYADGNMENMVKTMLENESCVYSAYTEHAIVKGYRSWDPWNPFRGLIPPDTDLPQENASPDVHFDIFPDPSVDPISFSYYFPTWADLSLTGIPDQTHMLRIRVYDKDSTLLIQGEKTINGEETDLDITYMADVCFPPKETYTIEITALNSMNQELTSVEMTSTMNVGRNSLQKQLQQSGGLTITFPDDAETGMLDAKRTTWTLIIDAKLQNRPNGHILYVWDSSGDSSLGGFGYFKQQHIELTDDDSISYYSNGTGEDGTIIPITCSAFLLKDDDTREPLGTDSADIEVYNPTQLYELCSDAEGTEGLRLGSGSSWTFYIVDHGPMYGNQFFARTGDQIRAYCDYAGNMGEGFSYDIYIRKGALDGSPGETQLIVSQSQIQDGLNKIVTITI